jgi:hypothetical protein
LDGNPELDVYKQLGNKMGFQQKEKSANNGLKR